jgi:hypothetical protein
VGTLCAFRRFSLRVVCSLLDEVNSFLTISKLVVIGSIEKHSKCCYCPPKQEESNVNDTKSGSCTLEEAVCQVDDVQATPSNTK